MAENDRRDDMPLIVALAAGRSIRDAAKDCDISETTCYRRLADPGFCRELSRVRSELWGAALNKLADGSTQAAAKLIQLLDSDDERLQLAAAKAILEAGGKLRDGVDTDLRLQRLEAVT